MPRGDVCHPQVVRALEKAGWKAVPRPFTLVFEDDRLLYIDILAQSRETLQQTIMIVEVKCFTNPKADTEDLYNAIGHPVFDDQRQIYAVVVIANDRSHKPPWVAVMARVVNDFIVIEEDRSLDKPLVDALIHNGGIPREKIGLAYAGESLPSA